MKHNFYKSTTALVMTLSLLQPVAAIAQGNTIVECTPELLRDGVTCFDPLTQTLRIMPADGKTNGKPEKDDKPEKADNNGKSQAAQEAVETDKSERAAAKILAEALEADENAAVPPCDPSIEGIVCDAPVSDTGTPQASTPDVPLVAPETDAARAANTLAPLAEVMTRTLTEANTRSSKQEFDNDVSAAPKADNGGLTDLEKAGLLLLGAVVVGTVLKNNETVVANTGDRVVVQDPNGQYRVYKDDDVLLMRPGSTVTTETFADGSTRSFVLRADGTQIVTIRDADGRVQRRVHVDANGLETTLIDDTRAVDAVDLRTLPRRDPQDFDYAETADGDALRQALMSADQQQFGRTFSLRQIREIQGVRELALEINLNAITFETNSSAIPPAQAEWLRQLGVLMADLVAQNPREIFLVEGHTDAVGEPAYNLALSDRRAETVALALSEYFGVPPENMVVQGYGEQFLKVGTLNEERRNRRVAVRRITGLLN